MKAAGIFLDGALKTENAKLIEASSGINAATSQLKDPPVSIQAGWPGLSCVKCGSSLCACVGFSPKTFRLTDDCGFARLCAPTFDPVTASNGFSNP